MSADADANTLNNVAWDLLITGIEEIRDPAWAMGYATRACALEEVAGGGNLWAYLDTLALAHHITGDTVAAVATQRRALALMPEGADPEMADRLAEYEDVLTQTDEADNP